MTRDATKEEKAATAGDVARDADELGLTVEASGFDPDTMREDGFRLARLRAAAMLGVQVPALQEQLLTASRDAVALVKAHDELDAARLRELAAIRAQVERLTKAASNCLDWLDCERDEDLKARAELRAALDSPPAEAAKPEPEDEWCCMDPNCTCHQ